MEVAHSRTDVTVTEQALDGMDVDAGLQEVGGKSVTQAVDATAFGQAGGVAYGAIQALNRFVVDRAVAGAVRKHPALRSVGAPVQPQGFEQAG